MDDIQGFIKKYWPYIVGGGVLLFILLRMNSGNSSGGGGGSYYAANAAASAQYAGQALQAQVQREAMEMQAKSDAAALALKEKELENLSQIGFLQAQGEVAQGVGAAAAGIMGALYQPSLIAMQSAAYENSATVAAAAQVAGDSFKSQAGMIESTSGTTKAVADTARAWEGVTAGISNMFAGAKTPFDQVMGTAGQLGGQVIMGEYFGNRPGFR